MADDHVFPDDFTYGFGGSWPKLTPTPNPIMVGDGSTTIFEAKRWCIEQVVTVRAHATHAHGLALHEEAAALFDFLFGPMVTSNGKGC